MVLRKNVKNKLSDMQGFYSLAKENINGLPYWKQTYGDHAVWFRKSWYSGWTVGHEYSLGHDYPGIIGPDDTTAWPTQIFNGYKYWDGTTWYPTTATDVIFKSCKFIYCEKRRID